MANKNNEVELLIKAKDEATKTLNATGKALSDLNKATTSSSKSILDNDKKLQQLNDSHKELQNVVGELGSIRKFITELQRAEEALNGTRTSIERAEQSLTEQRSNYEQAAAESNRLKEAVLQQKKAIDELSGSYSRSDAKMVEARDILRRLQTNLKEANAELRSQTTELNRAEQSQSKANAANKKAVDNISRLTTKAKELGVDTRNLTAEEVRLTSEINKSSAAMRKAKQEATTYAKELLNADKAARKLGDSTASGSKRFDLFADNSRKAMSVTQRFRGEVLSLASAYVGLYGAIGGVNSSFKSFNREQATQNKLLAALRGNVQAVNAEMQWLKELAEELGQPLADLEESYSGFFISATAQGERPEEIRYMFESLAQSATVMKWSTDDLNGAMRAFTQIMSKGKVMAEELQNQLGERFPGAVKLMADGMNVTTKELLKLMEQGQVSSEMLLGFALQASKMMVPGLETATKSLQSEMNRFTTSVTNLQRRFISLNEMRISETFSDLATQLDGPDGQRLIESFADAFDMLLRSISFVIEHLEEFKLLIKVILAYQVAKVVSGMAGSFMQLAIQIAAADKAGKGIKPFLTLLAKLAVVYASFKGIEFLANPDKQVKDLQLSEKAMSALDRSTGAVVENVDKLKESVNSLFSMSTIQKSASWIALAFNALNPAIGYEEAWEAHKKFINRVEGTPAPPIYPTTTSGSDVPEANVQSAPAVSRTSKIADTAAKDRQEVMELENELRILNTLSETLSAEVATLEQQYLKKSADTYEEQIALINAKYDALTDSAISLGQVEDKYALDRMRAWELEEALLKSRKDMEKAWADERKKSLDEIKEKEEVLNAMLDIRAMQVEEIARLREIGTNTAMAQANNIEAQLERNDQALKDMIAQIIIAYEAIDDGSPIIEAQIVKLGMLYDTIGRVGENVAVTAEQFNNMIADGLTDTFEEMAYGLSDAINGVGNLGDAFDRAGDAFRNFAREFMIDIGRMIVRAQILAALQGTSVGAMLSPSTTVAGVNHSGGFAGSGGANRSVSPNVFANAVRYHTGGIAGLRANEVPTILEKGEEVLTRSDPRHAMNGGSSTEVQIIDQRGVNAPPVDVQRSNVGGTEQIKVVIREEMKSAINNGQMDNTMKSNYGSSRSGVKR